MQYTSIKSCDPEAWIRFQDKLILKQDAVIRHRNQALRDAHRRVVKTGLIAICAIIIAVVAVRSNVA